MKKLLTISLALIMIDIMPNRGIAQKLEHYKTHAGTSLTATAFCAAVSSWELFKIERIISLGVLFPFISHIALGQAGSIFAAHAFSHLLLKNVVKNDTLDKNLVLNTIEVAFN